MNTCVKQSTSNNILKFDKCANCGACYNACPTGAITVKDGLFYSLAVDETKCVNCGKCISVCPVNTFQKAQNIVSAYSAEHKSEEVVRASSSGGAFSALADYILEQGGVVWGAGYSGNFDKVIFQSTKKIPLDNLRRSKYVESSVGNAFREIKEILNMGTMVLFCGTPCQVAGLKRFIGNHDNLYTADFSCGGLASHKLYEYWIDSLKKKYNSEIIDINFRSKYFGWGTHCIYAEFQNGKRYIKPAVHDPYFASFLASKLSVRDYCYQCQFSNNHYADLILADYWKYYDTYEASNHNGISLILVNSVKGEFLMKQIADSMNIRQLPLDKGTYNIKVTNVNSERYQKRASFLKKVEQDGFESAADKYCLPTKLNKIIYMTKIYIKKIMRRIK